MGVTGNLVSHTTDGGSKWNTDYVNTNDLKRIAFLDKTTGWLVGANGTILRYNPKSDK